MLFALAMEPAGQFLAGSTDVYMPGQSEGDDGGFDDPNDNNAKRGVLVINSPWD